MGQPIGLCCRDALHGRSRGSDAAVFEPRNAHSCLGHAEAPPCTRQHRLQHAAQVAQLRASDIAGLFTTIIRTLRMAMQSAMLGLGAWLVLQEQLSAGGMIATSILFGRLLNPLEVLIGSWVCPNGRSWVGRVCAASSARCRPATGLWPCPARRRSSPCKKPPSCHRAGKLPP